MFRRSYILSFREDLLWFLLLPFVAVGVALLCQQYLSAVVLAAVGVWVTLPHQFASWLRTWGLSDERRFWGDRLYWGPFLIFAMTMCGYWLAPISTAILVILWDHQHSIMQQHGFARIYDFRGRTGLSSTGWWDLLLGWLLFGHMLLSSPMFVFPLVRELHRLRLPISANVVQGVVLASRWALIVYLLLYLGHLVVTVLRGGSLNPVKYLFLGASYFLWYFCAWHTASVLVWGIAHRIMHGLQYMVMVYWYLRRQTEARAELPSLAGLLVRRGWLWMFVLSGVLYSVGVQLLTGGQLGAFLFGWARFPTLYEAIPGLGLSAMSAGEGYAFVTTALVNTLGMTHYYFDSFIWKVRDRRIHGGLA
jgi:hypothetical protein